VSLSFHQEYISVADQHHVVVSVIAAGIVNRVLDNADTCNLQVVTCFNSLYFACVRQRVAFTIEQRSTVLVELLANKETGFDAGSENS
jgi:hypothetical protein